MPTHCRSASTLAIITTAAIIGLAGCTAGPRDGDVGPGVVVTGDGRLHANTAEQHRLSTQRHIGSELSASTGTAVNVEISEQPSFVPSAVDPSDGDFRWSTATVVVSSAVPASNQPAVRDAIVEFLDRRVQGGPERIHVSFRDLPAAVPAPATVAAAPASAPVTATAAVSATPRTYTVQPGDTLADISTLFYGAPEHWRRITTANPAVDPARLSPGTVLSIP